MAVDFKVVFVPDDIIVKEATKASGTVLETGDLCTISAAVVIKALTASNSLGYVVAPAASGETVVQVVSDDRVVFTATGDTVFAATMKGETADLIDGTTQYIGLSQAGVTNVFKVDWGTDAGTVGSTSKIRVSIRKPI